LDADNFLTDTYKIGDRDILKVGGLRFVDFRGFVTCDEYPSDEAEENKSTQKTGKRQQSSDEIVDDDEPSIHEIEYHPIKWPFYKRNEEQRGRQHPTGYPDEKWARRRLDNVWPFLSLPGGDESSPFTGRTEFTVSRMLCGRALYATALAPQPQFGANPGLERPLHFYLHSVTQCERQIGRLIDRLCQAGTLRLAALIPLPVLKAVPEKLWLVEERIKTTRDRIHLLIQETKSLPPNNSKALALEKDILLGLADIQKDMSSLSAGTSIFDSAILGEESLEYRLERATYYKTNFYSLFKGMRIKRLEGYQPYDEFIMRRLQSAFGFIDNLEVRLKAIKADWRSTVQLYLSSAINVLTGSIEQQQEVLADAQTAIKNLQARGVDMLRSSRNTQREIMKIQFVGEIILWTILVPYYTLGLVTHFSNCRLDEWCAKNVAVWGIHVEPVMTVSVFLFWLAIGGIRALLNTRRISKIAKFEENENKLGAT
jgi:uncharacterized membrane-anchored protein